MNVRASVKLLAWIHVLAAALGLVVSSTPAWAQPDATGAEAPTPVEEAGAPAEPEEGADPASVDPMAGRESVDPVAAPVATEPAAEVAEVEPAPTGPAAAKEPEPVGLIPTASFMTRYELRENYADLGKSGRIGEGDGTAYRARFGFRTTPIDIDPTKKVILFFEPQASGFWADASSTLSDAAVGVHTAKLRLQRKKCWLDVGRFEMAYGDHLVIGNVGWHETGRTFDGIRRHGEVGTEGAWFDIFFTQVGEGRPTNPPGGGDTYFAGVYAGLGPLLGKGDLDAYVLALISPKDHADADPDPKWAEEITVGSRIKRPMGAADVRAEAGIQVGKRPGDVTAFAFQGEAEVGYEVAAGTRLAAGGFFASGDDPETENDEAWNQLFPTAHKFLGLSDIMGGRQNVMGGMLRAKHAAGKKVVVAGDAHLFLRPQTADSVDAYTGAEVDFWTLYKVGKGLGLKGGYSVFVPNESGAFGTDTLAHYVEVQLLFTLE